MKDKLLRLIDAYIQDDEAIKGTAKVVSTPHERVHVNSFEGVFIMNSKNTQKPVVHRLAYHNDLWVQNGAGYNFLFPVFEPESYDYYNMTFSFENQPPIQILNRFETLVVKQKGWGKKLDSFWISTTRKVELTFEFHTSNKPVYFLKCGTFEFDLTDEEVVEIYNKIEDRRLEVKKAAEMAELNKRFEKYGIQ